MVNIKFRPIIKNYEELLTTVTANENLITLRMKELRDIHGAERLGVHVCSAISGELARFGLAHYPKILPDHQDSQVRIFKKRSPVGSLIAAALKITSNHDSMIRKAASAVSTNLST
jgi:hypothetical protein